MRALSRIVDTWLKADRTKTTRHGKGLRWQAVWTDGRGREVKKSHRTKDAAGEWIKQKDLEQLTGLGGPQSDIFVTEAVEKYLTAQTHWQAKTRFNSGKTLRKEVADHFENQRLQDVTTDDVRDWVDEMRDRLAASTIRTYFSIFRAFMFWCVDEKYIPVSPTQRVKLPKIQKRKQHFLTPRQFWEFQAVVDPHFHDALETEVTTGLRPGELWELRGMDVGQKPGRLHVARSATEVDGVLVTGSTKTGESRDVPILGHVEIMLKHRAKLAGPDGLLFPDVDGVQVNQVEFHWKHVLPAIKHAGLPKGFRIYDLRHTAASWAIREGASVLAVQRMLGHANPTETLNTYAHLFDDELDQVAEGITRMLDRHRTATEDSDAA